MSLLLKGFVSIGVAMALSVVMICLASAEDVGQFGPPLGVKAMVVRTFSMKTTGAIAKEVKGSKGDGETALVGQCNPSMFANFGILRENSDERAQITIVSTDPIKTGMTGDIYLDKVYVEFFNMKDMTDLGREFGGKGLMKLTVHDASPGKRRMTGTIIGKKLEGHGDLNGKFIGVTASFDMDFSCGVK